MLMHMHRVPRGAARQLVGQPLRRPHLICMPDTVMTGSWTVRLCRGSPGVGDLAEVLTARGARVLWCGAGCDCGTPGTEEGMSVFDDGTDLAGSGVPAEEHRGGEHPDWDNARPGEPLPEFPPDAAEEDQ